MNIFKILANGDGSINEPNVSAFLGYLLNPYADHGLGFEFLDSFLKQIEIQDEKFITLKYDYEIFFEQAFKEEDKSKQIVDIVILCINNNIGKQKESYVKSILSNDKKVEYIFLIENKINKASKTANQLKDQFDSTIIELSKIPELKLAMKKIYSIYITPKEKH
ncbi:MAG: PD-(D/E)XK nuclease family protein [Bacteroidetes bacterium]|nr:PD-(D/E)XK nuclease family protein [Bacteroidota bacterium]